MTGTADGTVGRPELRGARLAVALACVAVLMFGFAFALVPLYDTLCRVLGINGRIEQSEVRAPASTAIRRDVRVETIVTGGRVPGWSFDAATPAITVETGELHTVAFRATNGTRTPMTVRAVPSVTPGAATGYLVKTDCFCFEAQTLAPGESATMPLTFYVSPDLPDKYATLTLSYALFEVTDP